MARISTYSTDSSITGTEKLLGTDQGTTKLFNINDLKSFIATNITISEAFGAAFTPSSDGAFDLGSSVLEWRDLFIDGTANIDSLVADTADINAGNIDGTIIGASSAAAGTFTTMNVTTLNVGGSAISLNDLSNVLIADNSLYVGHDPTSTDSTAQYNIALGVTALDAITTGDNNTAVGYNAGTTINTGYENTVVGSLAGAAIADGYQNVALGYDAGSSLTSGNKNVLVGYKAGESLTSAVAHVAVGYEALATENTEAGQTVAIGYQALKTQNGPGSTMFNVAVGGSAGTNLTEGNT